MELVFWISAGVMVYIFAGYPAFIFLASLFIKKPVRQGVDHPTVTFIIAAYNEAGMIKEKIYNTFELDYPKDKLQVIVFSDASSDHTDAIVKSFASRGIEFVRIEGRVGKTACQNEVIKQATGEIVVFSDANSMYDARAIKNLVRNFADDRVGVVVGELQYLKNNKSSESIYWRFERLLKQAESSVYSCLGANGAIYAIRRRLYVPLPADAISDFVEPFKIYEQGFRVVYESSARCVEPAVTNHREFSRKRRIVARALRSLRYVQPFLNPFSYGIYSAMLWSHKILRWFVLIAMAIFFISSALLTSHVGYFMIFALQLIFLFFAALGIFSQRKIFSAPYLFMVMYVSVVAAVVDVLHDRSPATWNPER